MRISILAAGLSLLMLPATSAFAEGEGTYQPAAVASPAAGPAASQGMASPAYSQGEGSEAQARPVVATRNTTHGPRAMRATYDLNPGLNG